MRYCILFLAIFGALNASHVLNEDGSSEDVHRFLYALGQSIRFGTGASFQRFISDEFTYKGCDRTFTREEVVKAVFIATHRYSTYSYDLIHSKYANTNHNVIVFRISVSSPDEKIATIVLVLTRENGVFRLTFGMEVLCGRNFIASGDGSKPIVKSFLANMEDVILSGKLADLGNFFRDNFEFIGCKGSYKKNKFVKLIGSKPNGSFRYVSSKYIRNYLIDYQVTVNGVGIASFQLSLKNNNWKLVSGGIEQC
uniref:NTF2-like domain-containing protein n=1 Tax=Caenorhabditis japonica TaxID=281687 RepID=A0A8R1HZT8_CAEJA